MSDVVLSSQLDGLIPEEIKNDIIKKVMEGSFALNNARVEPMTTVSKTIPIFVSVPGATFVGEGEKIKVGKPQVVSVKLNAKKIAIIMVASREALKDSVVNVFDDLKDCIAESFYTTIDKAVLTGDDKSGFKTVLQVATPYKVVATDKINVDISNAMGKVEENGFAPNLMAAAPTLKKTLRDLKDTTGKQLLDTQNSVYGVPMVYTTHFDNTKAVSFVGDFKNLAMGVYQGMEYEVLRESTLTLDDGTTVNLAQDDLLGIRVTMRVASQILKENAFSMIEKPKV